jgi:hypothetical protein
MLDHKGQNLVQFTVLRPIRRDAFWFDKRLLLEAKIAFNLKESPGTSTEVLALFAHALSNLKDEDVTRLRYLSLRSPPTRGREADLRICLRRTASWGDELTLQKPSIIRDSPHCESPGGTADKCQHLVRKRKGYRSVPQYRSKELTESN